MSLFQSFSGQIRLRLTGADIPNSLQYINASGIAIWDVVPKGELEAEFTVSRRNYRKLKALTQKKGDALRDVGTAGVYWTIRSFIRRPVLTTGLALLLLGAVLLSDRILFVRVEGNNLVAEQKILEAAKESGIQFGASRRQVRSEVMKNELLSQLPQLQWAGVNTYGSIAVITVRERSESEKQKTGAGISSIVAACDGVVLSCTVTEGTPLCLPGQAVSRGQVLISGYSDRGLTIAGTHAQGEVFASTGRKFAAVTPQLQSVRSEMGREKTNYSLLIGKKRINFYKGSGISGAGCVKMYSKYVLSLPGGFSLPVALIVETTRDSVLAENQIRKSDAAAQMSAFAEESLLQRMIAGTITQRFESVVLDSGCFRFEGRYACTEMIGRRQEEMIGENNGKSNGTDRERGSGG